MAQHHTLEELKDARRTLDYFLGLKPYEGEDEEDTKDTAIRRENAVKDIQDRIKELEEELSYGGYTGAA